MVDSLVVLVTYLLNLIQFFKNYMPSTIQARIMPTITPQKLVSFWHDSCFLAIIIPDLISYLIWYSYCSRSNSHAKTNSIKLVENDRHNSCVERLERRSTERSFYGNRKLSMGKRESNY